MYSNQYKSKGEFNIMKLSDLMKHNMKDILEKCNVVNTDIHSDDDGNIRKIVMQYAPKPDELNGKHDIPGYR